MEKAEEKDVLINRTQMIKIAWQHNIRISRSTIHRWANKPEFPLVKGQNGRFLLYFKSEYLVFLKRYLKTIQDNH
jgi:hypothetical protein